MNIYLEGELDNDLLKEDMPIHIACRVEKCECCDGYSEPGYIAEGNLPAKEAVKCILCEGKGYILNLNTAVRVEVKVVVNAYRQSAIDKERN